MKIKKEGVCFSAAFIFLVASFCGCFSQDSSESFRVVSAIEFRSYIEQNDVFLLDVFNGEHEMIPGTDAHIPYDKLEDNMDKLPDNKKAPIAVYCRLDPMSNQGVKTLVELGYVNVTKLGGGTTAWKAMGYALE